MGETPEKVFVYKTVGERRLTVEVDYPDDWREGDQRPAMVFFFGGAWVGGTTAQLRPQAEYFAQRGMVCVRVDYRVGKRDGVLPDQCVADALSAMRWVRANAGALGVDPNRLVSSGGSAGGHLAACTFFAEGVDDPNDDMSISPKPNAMVLYNPAVEAMQEHHPDLSTDTLARISPILHVSAGMPPTLMVDGTKDFFYERICDFVRKAEEVGAPIEAMWVEGQEHAFFNYMPWLPVTTERVDTFLQSLGYLSGTPKVPLPTKPDLER